MLRFQEVHATGKYAGLEKADIREPIDEAKTIFIVVIEELG